MVSSSLQQNFSRQLTHCGNNNRFHEEAQGPTYRDGEDVRDVLLYSYEVYVYMDMYSDIWMYVYEYIPSSSTMGWLRVVGSLKL